ncbi:alkaline phosphatase [uncultured Thiodictyon sp.]|uniref:alkaline phosphatase n=1 Tax=uncultured Thiodictyon sp. TaxID=1846217 RepID=UPI0025ED728C|nr:alkaline phosphatase [uncultured Thiodictyon sp.]
MQNTSRRFGLRAAAYALVLIFPVAAFPAAAGVAKNVILMISDGAAWGTWDLASDWEFGEKGHQPYDRFPVQLGMTTFPLNTAHAPTNSAAPMAGYDPVRAWDPAPNPGSVDGVPNFFNGYAYLKAGATDSAAAATAFASGAKTYNNALGVDNFGQPLPQITRLAKGLGKAVGVVSSVPFTHATPAAFGAHNLSRNHYGEIGRAMVGEGPLDLIMGGGNPRYDEDGRLLASPHFANETGPGGAYVARSTWEAVVDGSAGWQLIQSKGDFAALAAGTLNPSGQRLIGVPAVADSLQVNRTQAVQGADPANPSGVAFNPQVPTLETLSRGALNVLARDPDGFFVMIEGGAVDWAAHANNTGRLIEEQMDFNHAVRAVVAWVEANSSWRDTLLIVLTDHGTGMPMGPDSATVPFEPIRNHGAGQLPGVRWHTNKHANEIVLLRAIGAGSELFRARLAGQDPALRTVLGFNDGSYIDNTTVFAVMKDAMQPAAAPLAASQVQL